jgi:hypothetical protein
MSRQRTAYHRNFAHTVVAVLTLAIIASTDAPSAAQKEDRNRGFYLGVTFLGSSLHVDDDGAGDFFVKDDGGGALLRAGYSFNRVFSLEFALGGANHETSIQAIDADFAVFQLFFHYRFLAGRALRPYIKGGFGGYALSLSDNNASVRIDGGGIPIGGGFDYFFSKHFSLGVDLTHNFINYDKIGFDLGDGATLGFDIDEEGAMTTLGLVLTGYF